VWPIDIDRNLMKPVGKELKNIGKIDEATGKEYVERADAGVVVMILKTSSFFVEQGDQHDLDKIIKGVPD
ncbi:hypothetical protein Tco_0482000, partial [Tanacetum coccineum]